MTTAAGLWSFTRSTTMGAGPRCISEGSKTRTMKPFASGALGTRSTATARASGRRNRPDAIPGQVSGLFSIHHCRSYGSRSPVVLILHSGNCDFSRSATLLGRTPAAQLAAPRCPKATLVIRQSNSNDGRRNIDNRPPFQNIDIDPPDAHGRQEAVKQSNISLPFCCGARKLERGTKRLRSSL